MGGGGGTYCVVIQDPRQEGPQETSHDGWREGGEIFDFCLVERIQRDGNSRRDVYIYIYIDGFCEHFNN